MKINEINETNIYKIMMYGMLSGNDFNLVVEVNYLRIDVAIGRFYQVEEVNKNITAVIGVALVFF